MKLINWIKNLKFQKKLVLICLVCSLIPICVLGLFSYTQTKRSYLEREELYLSQSLSQEVQTIYYKLNSYQDSINLIVQHEALQTALANNYVNNIDMYIVYRDIIDPLLETIRLTQRDISQITIYSDCNIHPHGQNLRPLSEASETCWYNHVTISGVPTFYLSTEDQTLYLLCQMYDINKTNTHIICQKIDAYNLIDSLNNLCGDTYGLYLADKKQNLLYAHNNHFTNENGTSLSYRDILFNSPNVHEYIIEHQSIPLTEWTLYLYETKDVFLSTANQIFFVTLLICLFSMILSFITSYILSKITIKPLSILTDSMTNIEKNDYKTTLSSSAKDEIGHLIRTFSHMVARINYLINEVYKNEIAAQKYELKLLQAQINPHFFYNSLSMINNQAILNGQDSISKMALHLSTYYRTSLNNGKDYSTLRDELRNVNAYVEIMQMLREHSFQFLCETDEELDSIIVPNLIIQPLIENAILHGLDQDKTYKPGIITIQIFKDDSDLLIRVLDNGCGMEKSKCDSILSEESNHYGINNIHKRVQLLYGNQYGLSIQSTPNFGTSVTIRLKADTN